MIAGTTDLLFKCLGFDIKTWPHEGVYSIDDTHWLRHDETSLKAIKEFDLYENDFGLLDISAEKMQDVIDFSFCKKMQL